MVSLNINERQITVPEGTTILEAAASAGINIPHLCYLKGINNIGACRMCSVEVEGEVSLVPACNTDVREGMVVHTNTPRVEHACRTNLMFIMSQHDGHCSVCERGGNCQLQKLTNDFDLFEPPYVTALPESKYLEWDNDFPLIRDETKCIKCMRCIQICDKVQKLGVWDLTSTGGYAHVDVSGHKSISESDCSACGQCITHCPVGALRERKDASKVKSAIENPDLVTVVQIAPAVRAAWGEAFGLSPEEATVNRLAGALRALGFDYVFDTSFSADLTIMEEGSEFLRRYTAGELGKYPMFTSCCPAWVRFVKTQYPELVPQLSTAKSPQQMFGAVIKTYFAERIGVPAHKICSVSVMPCVAKKAECALPTMRSSEYQDVDYVLTTREIIRMLRTANISPLTTAESEFDNIMGSYTGAGVIFGTTGGVMEAALRSAAFLASGKNPSVGAFGFVKPELAFAVDPAGNGRSDYPYGVDNGGAAPWQEATFNIAGNKLKIAVTSGLRNADELCRAIVRGEVKYDFVEIMACPSGCAGGGGQPIHCDDIERGAERGGSLRRIDESLPLRFSHENPDIKKLYDSFLGEPLSESAEELLHTDHLAWKMPGEA